MNYGPAFYWDAGHRAQILGWVNTPPLEHTPQDINDTMMLPEFSYLEPSKGDTEMRWMHKVDFHNKISVCFACTVTAGMRKKARCKVTVTINGGDIQIEKHLIQPIYYMIVFHTFFWADIYWRLQDPKIQVTCLCSFHCNEE
jgi:hypothetical protein